MGQLLKNNLFLRILSAGIYLVILALSFLNKFTFILIFEFFMLQCLFEFYLITNKIKVNPKKYFALLFSAALFVFVFLFKNKVLSYHYIYVFGILLVISLIIEFVKKDNILKNITYEFMGIFYISVPFSLSNFLVFKDGNFDFKILLAVFFIIWAYDISAFFIGTFLGKIRIFPKISPNKTLEGTLGGLAFGLLAGFLVYEFLNIFSLADWLILALLIVVGAIAGDLTESKLKRSANVKDSGNLMPGHGGLLDRFDSFLFAIVAVSLYLYFFVISF